MERIHYESVFHFSPYMYTLHFDKINKVNGHVKVRRGSQLKLLYDFFRNFCWQTWTEFNPGIKDLKHPAIWRQWFSLLDFIDSWYLR